MILLYFRGESSGWLVCIDWDGSAAFAHRVDGDLIFTEDDVLVQHEIIAENVRSSVAGLKAQAIFVDVGVVDQ